MSWTRRQGLCKKNMSLDLEGFGGSPTGWKRGNSSFCLCPPGCTTRYGGMESKS